MPQRRPSNGRPQSGSSRQKRQSGSSRPSNTRRQTRPSLLASLLGPKKKSSQSGRRNTGRTQGQPQRQNQRRNPSQYNDYGRPAARNNNRSMSELDRNVRMSSSYGQQNPFSAKRTNEMQPRNVSYRDTNDYESIREQRRRPQEQRNRRRPARNPLSLLIFGLIAIVVVVLLISGIRAVIGSSSSDDSTSVLDVTPTPEATATPAPTSTPKPIAAEENDISDAEITQYDDMIRVGGSAFKFCKYSQTAATTVINALNTLGAATDLDVYYMTVPTAIDIVLPVSLLDEFPNQTSDQQKIESYILGSVDSSIIGVPIYDFLKAHCDEYLYFSSDTHITDLCAYYVYYQWAYTKGVTPISLSDCSTTEWTDFYGDISNETGISLSGDTITVYEPNEKLSYEYLDDYGMQNGDVFVDVSGYYTSLMYQTFLGGSCSYSVLTNQSNSAGASCVLVIDSNGTTVAPFVACNYYKTYIVDYRYYTEQKLSDLAESVGATDIIICTSTNIASDTSLADGLATICG